MSREKKIPKFFLEHCYLVCFSLGIRLFQVSIYFTLCHRQYIWKLWKNKEEKDGICVLVKNIALKLDLDLNSFVHLSSCGTLDNILNLSTFQYL